MSRLFDDGSQVTDKMDPCPERGTKGHVHSLEHCAVQDWGDNRFALCSMLVRNQCGFDS